MDKDLTVVLTLKDRISFTLRWMTYADRISFPFKVLIADGGKDDGVSAKLSKSVNFPNVNYEYIKYPYDETYVEYYAKIADVISKVETPFCVMADDDNFYSIGGLRKAVDFLESHPDYCACQGYTIGFRLEPKTSFYYGKHVSFSSPLKPHYSLDGNLAVDRLNLVSENNFATFYAVQRTENMKRIFDDIEKINFHDLYMFEAFIHFMTVSSGKVRQESSPYLYRQFDTYNSSNEQLAIVADNFDRMLWDTFSSDFEKFVESVSKVISHKDNCSIEDASTIVKKAFRKLIAPTIMDCLGQAQANKPIATLVRRGIIQNNSLAINTMLRMYRRIKGTFIRMPVDNKLVLSEEKAILSKYLTSMSGST